MKKGRTSKETIKAEEVGSVRASISFPPHLYETLETIAKEKKVSLAWVVRDAAEMYVGHRKAPARGAQK